MHTRLIGSHQLFRCIFATAACFLSGDSQALPIPRWACSVRQPLTNMLREHLCAASWAVRRCARSTTCGPIGSP